VRVAADSGAPDGLLKFVDRFICLSVRSEEIPTAARLWLAHRAGSFILSPPMTGNANELLKATARSFYLTLRVLPASVRPQISLAYLLARTTDTIADTEIVPLSKRLDALASLRSRIAGESGAPLNFDDLARHQGSAAERMLLEKISDSLAALQSLAAADRELVRAVLEIITGGQELDLQRFASQRPGAIIALKSAAELDDYTYRVAGCVGEFWTRLCRAHLFPRAELNEPQLIADGIRFGKGLQLVNILRDLPADLKNGRCYLPSEKLAEAGLAPENLLEPEMAAKFMPLYRAHLDLAEAHLAAGWRYTNSLPFGQFRVRLACAWPVLLGIKTIHKLRAANVGDLRQRVKVPRGEVYGLLARSTLACPFPFLWRKLYPVTRQ
jgi:farnesyl-diphosphate farnesyltransferase